MAKKPELELPAELDKNTRKYLEAYHKKIKNAEVHLNNTTDSFGVPKLRLSFETYDRKNRGFMEVTCFYG